MVNLRDKRPLWRRFDFTAVAGVPVGVGLILIGQAIEGGHAKTLLQLAALLVVFGGTFGAVLLSFGTEDVRRAVAGVRDAFIDPLEPVEAAMARILMYAKRARRAGVLSLDGDLASEPDPFLRRALTMAVDGASQSQIRHALEIEMDVLAERDDIAPRVFESAGGYAPTIGIIGAVLGLIHVMENLTDPSKLGSGIAIAFVATVYGVGSANLILLPLATKLRHRGECAMRRRELLLDAALAIHEGLNPQLVEQRLAGFLADRVKHPRTRTARVPLSAARRQA
jgi:chemotaxis protein MotA